MTGRAIGWSRVKDPATKEALRELAQLQSADAFSSGNWDILKGKPGVFPPAPHVHPYLPLSGGNLLGPLTLADTLLVNGNTTLKGTQVTVDAPAIMWKTLIVDGNLTGNATVSGGDLVSLTTLVVGTNATIFGKLDLTGNLTVGGKLTASLGFSVTAGEILGGDCPVAITGGKAMKASSDGKAAVGFTAHSAALGASVRIRQVGEATFAGLTTDKTYFLGPNGTITDTPPETGVLQSLGTALSATKLAIEIGPAIQR